MFNKISSISCSKIIGGALLAFDAVYSHKESIGTASFKTLIVDKVS